MFKFKFRKFHLFGIRTPIKMCFSKLLQHFLLKFYISRKWAVFPWHFYLSKDHLWNIYYRKTVMVVKTKELITNKCSQRKKIAINVHHCETITLVHQCFTQNCKVNLLVVKRCVKFLMHYQTYFEWANEFLIIYLFEIARNFNITIPLCFFFL